MQLPGKEGMMPVFTIKLADIPIGIKCLYESTETFCEEFQTEEAPAFTVELGIAEILNEREIAKEQDIRDGISPQPYSDEYLETIALYRKLAEPLLNRNCLIFHGAVVAVHGCAYLFTAKSGTGKTTHAKLWLKNIENSYILNGDKPLIKIEKGRIITHGTPWRGKEEYGINESLPLSAICVLERDTMNHIERISASEAFPILYQQSHHVGGFEEMGKTLELLDLLAQGVRLYRLGCNMEDEAAMVSFGAMSAN